MIRTCGKKKKKSSLLFAQLYHDTSTNLLSSKWREINPGKWRGIIGNRLWTLSQDESHISYQVHTSVDVSLNHKKKETPQAKITKKKKKTKNLKTSPVPVTNGLKNYTETESDCNGKEESDDISEEKFKAMLKDYFQLDISLEKMYLVWAKADSNFATVCPQFPGVRMLNQNPVENVFSFICSSNNNIQRITKLVERLCQLYGSPLSTVDGITWHSFPDVSSLAAPGVEETLRDQGFGYRAKYIHKSAQMIMEEGGDAWLHSLRSLPYQECHSQLMRLQGIGAKVSDCICLMSMGHLGAIPVDTHVFQIAARDYLPHLRSCKTVTDKVYREIADHFRCVFGEYAGWAHSVLFSADLKKFETLKTEEKQVKKKQKTTKSRT
ncbi:N-glycosylase/DNA lyase-like isoform X1 [Homarus americanus]|uniref:N-glycosylase/DNA lyase-like isoform X1 n=1 Tax=Homarus americanus TaxID=6706 RepID=UPI001C48C3F8|nr:N-glycosylase/DNA lyase-like isoform X1 [Homarus americanus]